MVHSIHDTRFENISTLAGDRAFTFADGVADLMPACEVEVARQAVIDAALAFQEGEYWKESVMPGLRRRLFAACAALKALKAVRS